VASSTALRLNGSWLKAAAIALILAFAAASIGAQLAGGAFGRNGAIRAFEATQVHGVPVAVDSSALALTAVWIGLAAAAARVHGARGARAWGLLALLLAALSAQRLALPPPRDGQLPRWLPIDHLPESPMQMALLAALAAAGIVVARATLTAATAPAQRRLATGTALLAAAAGLAWWARRLSVPGAHTLPVGIVGRATLGQAIELTGVLAIVDAGSRHLAAIAPDVRLAAGVHGPGVVGVRALVQGVAVDVSARRTAWALGAMIAALVTASTVGVLAHANGWPGAEGLHRLFYVDSEGNLPTWCSAMELLACGVVSATLAAAGYARDDGRWRYWALLAVVFTLLSTDEASALHELIQGPLRAVLHHTSWLQYPLIIPGIVAGTLLTLGFRRFVATLGSTRRWLVGGALIFAGGAFGVETLGGWYAPEIHGENVIYILLATLEETCEMVGVAVVLVGLLKHAAREACTLRLALPGSAPTPGAS